MRGRVANFKYIDLSYTIEEGLATHPYDEALKLGRSKFLEGDGFNDSRFVSGMHVGTHIDAPSHMTAREVFISDYSPERFIGKACVLDVRNQALIEMQEVYYERVEAEDIVLLYTGFDAQFGSDAYFEAHPVIEAALAKFFIEKRVKMVGMDMPSPDRWPFDMHKMLLDQDILIIENLRGLEALLEFEAIEIIALPMKIRAEGSPVRVVARVGG